MVASPAESLDVSRFISFRRAEWARLRASTPLTLSSREIISLKGINDRLSLDDVTEIYLPLSRLLNLYVVATQSLYEATDLFLGHHAAKAPYIVGIAGSVAVGKSTTARVLQALLSRWPTSPRVDLVTTDGFLYPNRVLAERGLMARKGFPESYDVRALLRFLANVKAGRRAVSAPIYSHESYDILPNQRQVVHRPDIIIVEGLNVLQTSARMAGAPAMFVSDFFDFSIYVDADVQDVARWYVERFLTLRETAFRDPANYFARYADLSPTEAVATAQQIWHEINEVNLVENIRPTRERAHLILEKGSDHSVVGVRLRKL